MAGPSLNTTAITGGLLRQSITVQRRSAVADGAGNNVGGWSNLYTGLRAYFTPITGRELLLAQGLQAVATGTWWVRSFTETRSIVESDRILDERTTPPVYWQVRYITNLDGANKFLQLTCTKGEGTD